MDALGIDAFYPRLCVGVVGDHSDLPAGKADGIVAGCDKSHCKQRNRLLLAGT